MYFGWRVYAGVCVRQGPYAGACGIVQGRALRDTLAGSIPERHLATQGGQGGRQRLHRAPLEMGGLGADCLGVSGVILGF